MQTNGWNHFKNLASNRPDASVAVTSFLITYSWPQSGCALHRPKSPIFLKCTYVWVAILTKSNLRKWKNKWNQTFSGWSFECLERPETLERRLHVANFFIWVYENPKLCDCAKYRCQFEATQNGSLKNGDKFMKTQLFSNRWNMSTSLYYKEINLLMVRCTTHCVEFNFRCTQGGFRAKYAFLLLFGESWISKFH